MCDDWRAIGDLAQAIAKGAATARGDAGFGNAPSPVQRTVGGGVAAAIGIEKPAFAPAVDAEGGEVVAFMRRRIAGRLLKERQPPPRLAWRAIGRGKMTEKPGRSAMRALRN